MTVDDEDQILGREFREAIDQGPPQPSWSEIEKRAGRFSLRRQGGRLKLVPALAVLLLVVAIPALAFAAGNVLFNSGKAPFQSAIYAFAEVGGPPGTPADTPMVSADPRRVMVLPLSKPNTAALWVAPTSDGNYCFDTQVATDEADYLDALKGDYTQGGGDNMVSPGQGLDWGAGFEYNVGCGSHDGNFDVAFDVGISGSDNPFDIGINGSDTPIVLVSGGSGLQDADTIEVKYQDGGSDSFPTMHVSSPVDATMFMFQIPVTHTTAGSRPVELVLKDKDGNVLASDEAALSNLWAVEVWSAASYKGPDGSGAPPPAGSVPPQCDLFGQKGLNRDGPLTPSNPDGQVCSPDDFTGKWSSTSIRPNSPRYQFRNFQQPNAPAPVS